MVPIKKPKPKYPANGDRVYPPAPPPLPPQRPPPPTGYYPPAPPGYPPPHPGNCPLNSKKHESWEQGKHGAELNKPEEKTGEDEKSHQKQHEEQKASDVPAKRRKKAENSAAAMHASPQVPPGYRHFDGPNNLYPPPPPYPGYPPHARGMVPYNVEPPMSQRKPPAPPYGPSFIRPMQRWPPNVNHDYDLYPPPPPQSAPPPYGHPSMPHPHAYALHQHAPMYPYNQFHERDQERNDAPFVLPPTQPPRASVHRQFQPLPFHPPGRTSKNRGLSPVDGPDWEERPEQIPEFKLLYKELKEREQKNRASRALAARRRERIDAIRSKPENQRTVGETRELEDFEARRIKKNNRTRQRNKQKRIELERIQTKPEHERTMQERQFVAEVIAFKKKKNQQDRLRRRRIKREKRAKAVATATVISTQVLARSESPEVLLARPESPELLLQEELNGLVGVEEFALDDV